MDEKNQNTPTFHIASDDSDVNPPEDHDTPSQVEIPPPADEPVDYSDDRFAEYDEPLFDTPPGEEDKKPSKWPVYLLIALAIAAGALLISRLFTDEESGTEADLSDEIFFVKETLSDGILFQLAPQFEDQVDAYQWEVYVDGELVDTYDSRALKLPTELKNDYRISLSVKFKDGTWSTPYSEELNAALVESEPAEDTPEEGMIYAPDNEEDVRYDAGPASSDTDQVKAGTHSHRFDLTVEEPTATLTLEAIEARAGMTLSFWIRSDQNLLSQIDLKGYNGSELVLERRLPYRPSNVDTWEMLSIEIDQGPFDRLVLTATGESTLWIDDLTFNTLK